MVAVKEVLTKTAKLNCLIDDEIDFFTQLSMR